MHAHSKANGLAPFAPADVVAAGLCIGCGSCVAAARALHGHANDENDSDNNNKNNDEDSEDGDGNDVRMVLDGRGELKPAGPVRWLSQGQPGFSRTCPFSAEAADETSLATALFADARHGDARVGRFEAAYVGHAAQGGFRERGSSGGMVSWTAAELLRTGLVDAVAHVAPGGGGRLFGYRISRSADELAGGAKSRYYPVELSHVLGEIRRVPGRYAVVGVPCFIKAVQLLRREDALMRERIAFTLGLFCGHMKSARLVDSFAYQMNVALADVRSFDFRLKDARRPASWYTAHFELRDGRTVQRDWFHLAEGDWGSGFFQNAACNFCDDVVAETADIAFGDAWVEPYASDGRGTNVVIARSPQLARMLADGIESGRLALAPVDADFVAQTQAAGLRQRREGLAYRLSRRAPAQRPRKRVAPSAGLPLRRKLIYRTRGAISAWSVRLFALARATGAMRLYVLWAHGMRRLYAALAYSSGRLGAWLARRAPDTNG
jgi:coenzyme F420-reducing hydrogenase beta subunit